MLKKYNKKLIGSKNQLNKKDNQTLPEAQRTHGIDSINLNNLSERNQLRRWCHLYWFQVWPPGGATANRTIRRLKVYIVLVIEPRPLWSKHSLTQLFYCPDQHWVMRLELMTCNSQQIEQPYIIRQRRES